MKRIILFLWALLILCSANVAFAVRMSGLYQGIIPVATQSVEERNQVASQVLAQVLVKVSGNPQILNEPKIKAHLGSANSLMQEFSYRSAAQLTDQNKPYLLQLDFDPEGVNKILREAGAPIWGQNRPLLVVWLDYETPTQPAEAFGADSGSMLVNLLKQKADLRGVPVIFPVMDVTDLSQASINDIVTFDLTKLANAAKRYASDAILVGRIMQDTNGYNTQWRLVMGKDQWGWNITGPTIPDTLTAMIDHVADTLAGRYATVIANTVQSTLMIKITHITEADDFSQIINYLKNLTPVSAVQLLQVTNGDMVLQISLRGTQESFNQIISVGQKLTPVPSDSKQAMLTYQWNH